MSRKINLKKPLKLMEEFAAIEQPDNTTATETNTAVKVDQTGQTGAEIRAEIIADVDTILTNLETLSKQITEEVLLEADKNINAIFESEFTEPVNEDFMAELIKQAKSMKAYAVLKSSYPKLKKNLATAKANKIESEQEFELNSDEKIGDLKDKIKAKYQKAIDKINSSDLPTPKKKAQRDAIYTARDEALSPEKSQMIKDKITAEKAKLVKKNDAAVRDVNTAITELTGENKIEAELMSKRWEKEKIEIDDQFDQEAIDTELELKMKYSKEDPQAQKKLQARYAERDKEEKEEKARRAKEAAEDLKAYQAKLAEEDANASAEEKEAREKVNAFVSSSQALIGILSSGGDKEKIKEANKTYTEAKAAATDGVYKATKEGMSDDDAKEAKLQIETAVEQAMEKYKTTLREITTDQKKKEDEKYEMTDDDRLKVSDEENQMKERQKALAAEEAKPEGERNQGKIDGLKAGIAKNKQDIEDIKAGKKAGNESVEVEETEEVSEGMHPKIKKAMKAVADGETVYGENIRFPGRFKIIEIDKGGFATVDYEDGTDPMQMAAMNIAIDSLSFESAEVEEGNAFGAARAEAIAKGEKTFKVGDEEYDVESVDAEDKENAEEYAEEEGIATEAVTESASFKLGSVADRFKSLM